MTRNDAQNIAQGDLMILEGLLVRPTITAVAEYASCSPDTVYRRLRDPEFAAELERLKAERLEFIISKIDRASQLAIDELTDVLTKENTSDRDRIAAARAILSARGMVMRSDPVDR